MTRQRVRTFIVSLHFLAVACGGSDSTTDGRPDIAAHWVSACVPTDSGAITLDVVIDASHWKLDYDTYGDGACASHFVTIHIEGSYELTSSSSVVNGAWNARFGFDQKTVTPRGDAAVGFLTGLGDACGGGGTWSDGVARDVYASGCAMLGQYPSSSCMADFDLVSIDGSGLLHLGQRPADNNMCTEAKRPTALSPVGLTRTSP
jgi:hypothetical protein